MKHVKFQVTRQGQYEPVPADRERGGESAETSRQRRVLTQTHEWSHQEQENRATTAVRMLLMQDRVLGETVGDFYICEMSVEMEVILSESDDL